ncbi:MAG: phosphoribosylanthranilate isomerase [Pseudomonadota bacterium]
MSVTAKICGLTTPQTVSAALEGGASHLGFMFFAKSPRNIDPEMAARLTPPARAKNAKIVAVTVDPDDALVEQLAATLKPDFIQLHGKETPARARQVALRSGAGVIKVISVSSAHDIDTARPYESVVDHLMFDARPPSDHPLPGGAGARFDWTLLAGRRFERPWFLAGGLDPWNVGEAVRLSGAPLVDVSSGVERGPGLKDPALIMAFLDAVRRA